MSELKWSTDAAGNDCLSVSVPGVIACLKANPEACAEVLAGLGPPRSNRDTDWALAMASALGFSGGFKVPILPEPEPFRELFADIRERAKAETVSRAEAAERERDVATALHAKEEERLERKLAEVRAYATAMARESEPIVRDCSAELLAILAEPKPKEGT